MKTMQAARRFIQDATVTHSATELLAGTMQSVLGSTRAPACSNGRPARWFAFFDSPIVWQNNARPVPRGRVTLHARGVRSPFQSDHSGLD